MVEVALPPRDARRRARADAQGPAGRGQPGPVPGERRAGRAGALLRRAAHRDRGHPVRAAGASELRVADASSPTLLLRRACSGGTPALVATRHALADRRSTWCRRPTGATSPLSPLARGRPPALSLQELFHPTYNVPLDPDERPHAAGDRATSSRPEGSTTSRRSATTSCGRSGRPPRTRRTRTSPTSTSRRRCSRAARSAPAESFTFCGDARFVERAHLHGGGRGQPRQQPPQQLRGGGHHGRPSSCSPRTTSSPPVSARWR